MIKPLPQNVLKQFAIGLLFFLPVICFAKQPIVRARSYNNSQAALPADSVTLIDGSVIFTLDTLKSGIRNEYTVTLSFKLKNYSHSHKDTLKVILNYKPAIALNNLVLYKEDTDPAVVISKSDWGNSTDSTIKKTVTVTVKQTDVVTSLQEIIISPASRYFEGNFAVRFMPYAGKVKPATASKLVQLGNAEIVYTKKLGITHDYLPSINSINTLTVTVRLHGNYDASHNQLMFAFLDTTLSKHFQITENPVTITESQWDAYADGQTDTTVTAAKQKTGTKNANPEPVISSKAKKGDVLPIKLHIRTVNVTDSLNTLENLFLTIKGQSQANPGTQSISVSIKDVPFWAEGGTNFALLDNIKTNNFYAGVYMFSKDIARIGGNEKDTSMKDEKNNDLSFVGGVYESQSIGSSATSSAGIAYRSGNTFVRDTGSVKANTGVKSIGILFSPHLKITNGKTDANGFHMFVSLYAELLWQTVTSTFDYSKAAKDTAIAVLPPGKTIANYPYKEGSVSYDSRSHYIGLGLPVYIKENEFTLYINSVIGATNQKFYVSNNAVNSGGNNSGDYYLQDPATSGDYIKALTFNSPAHDWNGFLLFQYRLNDVAYGITFSGEIRELLLSNAKPVVTLALSKKFNLSKLFNSLFAADK